jgi:hypothetical protein
VTRLEGDPVLQRIERTAIAACLVMTAAAFVLTRRPGPPVAVLGGGLLIAISYRTIGSGVSALVALLARGGDGGTAPRSAPHLAMTLAKVAGRYALLALLAYGMIARLRLHPIGLLAGASSVVAAAAVEAIRLLTKKQP